MPLDTDALDKASLPVGFTGTGLGTNYTTNPCATSLRIDSAGDNVILFFSGVPGTLSYQLKANVGSGSWQGVFLVEESPDGVSWTTLRNISTTGEISTANSGTTFIDNPLSTTRYIRWIYNTKTNGNVAMCNVDLTAGSASTYTVTYDGNGNDSGSVPLDGTSYNSNDPVTVSGNTGGLGLSGFVFNGWNTAADGSGTAYVANDTFNITANTTLYAQWLSTSPPVITSSLTDSGTVGATYTYNIVATNSPTSYSAAGLPAGLSINTSTGEITGIVGTAGVYNIDITATNAYGSDTQTLVVTILNCFTDDFSGTLSQWSNTADWTISTGEIRDNTTVAGTSYFYTNSVIFNLGSANYEWNFCMRNGSFDPSSNNKFAYHIVSTNSNFTSAADGYAVGVNMSDTSDLLTLYSVSGTTYTPIITTTFDWNASDDVCIRVTRTASGSWELFYNPNGSGEVSAGTISDTTITSGNYMGGQFIHSVSNVKLLWFDDISVCSSDPIDNEIDVQGNSISIVNGDNTPSTTDDTDFGTTLVGSDVSHTFTITNAGPDDLDISGITITGVDAADFYISVNPASTITAGGSTTFEVTFSPSVIGISNATINIANNDSDENPYSFDITGEAITCTPTTSVTSISPSSGPVGTMVTINGNGFTTATAVNFGAYSATFNIISNTLIEAIVPASATTSNIIIQDAGGCELSYSSFTVITNDNSSCEGVAVTTDLIIYDLHDEKTGSLGFITLYNGTSSTVDMSDYSLWRTSNYGDGNEIDYADLIGTIAPGDLGVIRVSVPGCGPASTNGTIDNGFNENDGIQLRNAAGTIIIDDVQTYVTAPGYYMVRNAGAYTARTTYVAADWSITPLAAGECYPSAGLTLPSNGNSPTVDLNPVDVNVSCASTTASFSVAGSEGVSGGLSLAYQWYVNIPGNSGWTEVVNGGVYSGATSSTLNISSTSGLNNYQYYCQIREDSATCYTATEAAIIIDGTTTWNGSAWSNGVPNLGMLAIIDGDYDTTINGSFSCCSLVVNSSNTLDIQALDYVEIQFDLTVNGVLNVWDDGSLVQIDDSGTNTGNILFERNTSGNTFDYVYWSSPVSGVVTPASGYVFTWDADISNPNSGWGYWISSLNTAMAPGVGYIMRDVFSRTFVGQPNNGIIQPSISRANYTGADFTGVNGVTITNMDDNWNLVGNPYPSAISALDFLTANTNIEGAVRIWTHGTTPSTSISDPVYDNYVYNYTVNDYIVYNGTGTVSGPGGFNGFIAGGQSFMVSMNDGSATTETVTFNNSMRNRNHNNEQFYKQNNSIGNKSLSNQEKHRIWLDLANAQNNSTRTLVGYISNATNGKDRLFDAVTNAQANEMGIYSIIDDERMLIQGRTLPFDNQDKVQLAVNIPSSGTYSIGLSALDGLFNGSQDIYLEDKELGIIHDLRTMPYSFQAQKGEFKNRFVLRYTNETLSEEEVVSPNDIVIATLENGFNIVSNKQKIKSVTIHNVLGQIVFERKNVNSNEIQVSEILKNNQALILNLVLDNNIEITKKVIF